MQLLEIYALNDLAFLKKINNLFARVNYNDLPKLIWQYVRENINYKSDDYTETLIAPNKILSLNFGDCDDMALLVKTILSIFSVPSQYLIMGEKENVFTHIVVYTMGVIIDPTNNDFNKMPEKYKFYKFVEF